MKTKINFFDNFFVKEENNVLILDKKDSYTENFGKQWRDYRDVQIDSLNNFNISQNYLDLDIHNFFLLELLNLQINVRK